MNKPDRACTTLFEGRFLKMLEIDSWEFTSRSNATGVVILIAVTDSDELVLVEQFRIPVDNHVIELPAGLVGDVADADESLLKAAERELLEETGFVADQFEIMLTCPSSAGMSDEMITYVRASGLKRVSQGGGDSTEDITVHVIPLKDVDQWLMQRHRDGTPLDSKIFSALFWLQSPPNLDAGQ
jgi:ADP-ribose pyrophosphatase